MRLHALGTDTRCPGCCWPGKFAYLREADHGGDLYECGHCNRQWIHRALKSRPGCGLAAKYTGALRLPCVAVENLSLWRVARKPRQGEDYRLIYQGDEGRARKMYDAMDVRQGGARLLRPGQPLATCVELYEAGQSGPKLRGRW